MALSSSKRAAVIMLTDTTLLFRVQSDLFFVSYHPNIFRIAPSDSILGRKWNKLYLNCFYASPSHANVQLKPHKSP